MTVIYLDMDGVIADFVGSLLRVHNRPDFLEEYRQDRFPRNWDFDGVLGDESSLWFPVDYDGHTFWSEIQPYPWMFDILKAINYADIPYYICTHPRNSIDSYAGKMMWIHKHLGVGFDRVIMCKDKYRLAHKDAYLIDDNERNCQLFEKYGGTAFLFPQPWNSNKDLVTERVEQLSYFMNDVIISHESREVV